MEWVDVLAEWILFPLLIIYGFVNWAKDHPQQSLFDPFKTDTTNGRSTDQSENGEKNNSSH